MEGKQKKSIMMEKLKQKQREEEERANGANGQSDEDSDTSSSGSEDSDDDTPQTKPKGRKLSGGWSDDEDGCGEEEAKEEAHPTNPEGNNLRNSVLFNKTPAATRLEREKKAKRFPVHLREHVKPKTQRHQSNSTSSLFVTSTPSSPDINGVLKSMATAIYFHIVSGHKVQTPVFFDIFNEELHPISKKPVDTVRVPRIKEIYKFIATIFKVERLPSECAILCLAYIERLISQSGITLHASNWRRIVLSALILASKVWEDQAVWNVDFLSVFPNASVHDLRLLEKKLLGLLEYNVNITGSLYAKYYFELRELAEKDDKRFPLQPLDKDGVKRLEERANTLENQVRRARKRSELNRASSSDNITTRSPRVVLS